MRDLRGMEGPVVHRAEWDMALLAAGALDPYHGPARDVCVVCACFHGEMDKHAVITGGAGFIGSHLVDKLIGEGGWRVTVIDNFHPNYSRSIKESNLAGHKGNPAFRLVDGDVLDRAVLEQAFDGVNGKHVVVVHLAALVGVRPSIIDPKGYLRVNTTGTLNLLEMARERQVGHFLLGSSSSVYGEHPGVPWKEDLDKLRPISPYAVSKLAAEEFVRVYARLHGLDATVLRFFTVYGPRQRPDLAIHAFYRKIMNGQPIQQFGDGSTSRDYTYIADIINGVRRAMERPMYRMPGHGSFEIYNLGHSEPVALRDLITAIEQACGSKARTERLPEQPGDVPRTYANVDKAGADLGYRPLTTLAQGLQAFAEWYADQGAMASSVRDA